MPPRPDEEGGARPDFSGQPLPHRAHPVDVIIVPAADKEDRDAHLLDHAETVILPPEGVVPVVQQRIGKGGQILADGAAHHLPVGAAVQILPLRRRHGQVPPDHREPPGKAGKGAVHPADEVAVIEPVGLHAENDPAKIRDLPVEQEEKDGGGIAAAAEIDLPVIVREGAQPGERLKPVPPFLLRIRDADPLAAPAPAAVLEDHGVAV